MKTCVLIVSLLAVPVAGIAQDIVKYDGSSSNLNARWSWAQDQLDRGNSERWIGYSIERLMNVNSYTGHYSNNKSYPTFGELLYGITPERPSKMDQRSKRKVMKEVVIMFHYNKSGTFDDVLFSTLNGDAHIDDDILWLGRVEIDGSLARVDRLMKESGDDNVREDLVAAISMHDSPQALSMLRSTLKGDDGSDVREQAAFWMSQVSDSDAVLDDLLTAANNDRSEDVQEQAVFAISQIDTDKATNALISLAKRGPLEIRDESIFWLGQRATEKATESLAEIVDEDPNYEVKKQAVFALSQQDSSQGLSKLIEIARTHESAALRKDAIFWLSQSDDPAALDALVDIVRG